MEGTDSWPHWVFQGMVVLGAFVGGLGSSGAFRKWARLAPRRFRDRVVRLWHGAKEAMAVFGRRRNEIQTELRNLKGDTPLLDTATLERLGEIWPELDTTDRQAAIGVVAAGVEIQPAKYRGGVFDPERVKITWQGQDTPSI